MKLYFDTNVYNRIFDDQNQLKIRFETMAIDTIMELVEKESHKLVWSFMLNDENDKNPYANRRKYVELLSGACMEIVEPSIQIKEMAQNIMSQSTARVKDSLHLACAAYAGSDYFITCDDRFIKTIMTNIDVLKNIVGDTRIINPIDFLREEMKIDVIE